MAASMLERFLAARIRVVIGKSRCGLVIVVVKVSWVELRPSIVVWRRRFFQELDPAAERS